jgi:hypothetical protein
MARFLQRLLTEKEYFIGTMHAFVIPDHQVIAIIRGETSDFDPFLYFL